MSVTQQSAISYSSFSSFTNYLLEHINDVHKTFIKHTQQL